MLNYQTTGFHETAALRELFGLTAIKPFQDWLEKMGFVRDGKLTELAGGRLRAAGVRRPWGPPTKPSESGFIGGRTNNGMNEPCRLRRGEEYGVCEDDMNDKELRALIERMIAEVAGQAPHTPR